ncbi:SseB family protein [Leptolyngbya ohadii]|uniref:SseB family protein n=1 Tax=Leptolyngbya ohadii TaxID=1962290 RepID=UPI0015C5F27F|nr:SseB family protein [Leptolyngbya ohadii]
MSDQIADFDTLARQAQATQAAPEISRLYEELFSLESWYLLHDPDAVQQPLILELEDSQSVLPAFTDGDRAERWAEQSGFYASNAKSPVMVVPVAQCVLWIQNGGLAEADEVSSLCFNLDTENFLLPVASIQQIAIES